MWVIIAALVLQCSITVTTTIPYYRDNDPIELSPVSVTPYGNPSEVYDFASSAYCRSQEPFRLNFKRSKRDYAANLNAPLNSVLDDITRVRYCTSTLTASEVNRAITDISRDCFAQFVLGNISTSNGILPFLTYC